MSTTTQFKQSKFIKMKKTKIIYWIFTTLFALLMFSSAVPDILSVKVAADGFTKMGMPVYLLPFLGIAKALGAMAILVPGFPRVKEWAYAGLVFDLLGATYSIAASGQPMANWIFMALPLILAAGSYTWYHRLVKVRSVTQQRKTTTPSVFSKETSAVAETVLA
jgi:uncharacterized membrane protein YphA (DoxX/SURF4 family)